ncbi:MAG TPA: hypothetical protein VK961_17115 [Chthoniobacter sp.]|nr:hypothetical protein [Chthoniobacter sp.]
MRASLLWPVLALILVVVGFRLALEQHRQRLEEELERVDQEHRQHRQIDADLF